MGGIIGWERRTAERAAGIRTMALISLGSALFTLCSMYSFASGPVSWWADEGRWGGGEPAGAVGWRLNRIMTSTFAHVPTTDISHHHHVISSQMAWDASRVSAAIPR